MYIVKKIIAFALVGYEIGNWSSLGATRVVAYLPGRDPSAQIITLHYRQSFAIFKFTSFTEYNVREVF